MITLDSAINRIAERTLDNTKDIRQMKRQRRNQVVDIYGMEFTRQGGPGAPATFYISISTDMIYLERFQFKLIIQPFLTTTGTSTGQSQVTIQPTELTIPDYAEVEQQNMRLSEIAITPNPHTHEVSQHSHSTTPGASLTPVTAADFLVSVEGIDVTPYLMAQYGNWIHGEGVYPSMDIGHDYDILEVASDFCAEGRYDDAETLTRAGYKQVQVTSQSLFSVSLVLYCKYSHCNR